MTKPMTTDRAGLIAKLELTDSLVQQLEAAEGVVAGLRALIDVRRGHVGDVQEP